MKGFRGYKGAVGSPGVNVTSRHRGARGHDGHCHDACHHWQNVIFFFITRLHSSFSK